MVFGERFLEHGLLQLEEYSLERSAILGGILYLVRLVVLADKVGLTALEMPSAISGKDIQLSLYHIHQHVFLYHRLEFLLLVHCAAEKGLHIIVELYSGFKHMHHLFPSAKVRTFSGTMVFSTVFFTLLYGFLSFAESYFSRRGDNVSLNCWLGKVPLQPQTVLLKWHC